MSSLASFNPLEGPAEHTQCSQARARHVAVGGDAKGSIAHPGDGVSISQQRVNCLCCICFIFTPGRRAWLLSSLARPLHLTPAGPNCFAQCAPSDLLNKKTVAQRSIFHLNSLNCAPPFPRPADPLPQFSLRPGTPTDPTWAFPSRVILKAYLSTHLFYHAHESGTIPCGGS